MYMLDKRIKFKERQDNADVKLTILYFTAPKELFEERGYDFTEAVSVTIRVDFPINDFSVERAEVLISPVDEFGEHYDWRYINVSKNEVKDLIALSKRAEK